MIFGYLIVLLRHLKKRANIAVINMLSYGFGIAACLILIQYIYYETSYDKFYKDYENIYRISLDNYYSGDYQNSTAFTFLPIGPELKEKYSEVQEFTVVQNRTEVVSVEEKTFFEKHILVADTNYFRIFPHDMLKGITGDARPTDIFISETIATKYFGETDPIGNTMKVFRDFYTVKGVFKDLPANTHLKFDILCMVPVRESNDWNVAYMYSYVKLNGDSKGFSQKLKSFSKEFSQLSNQQSEADYTFQIKLQPLASIHLQSALLDEFELNGQLEDIYTLAALVIIILIISCFNYINLTNAINSDRSKEIFIRKIHGAPHQSTIAQHITESLALNVAGFAIGLFFLIAFTEWIGPYYDFPYIRMDWTNTVNYYTLVVIFAIALILSGIIPAILTSYSNLAQFPNRTSTTNKVNIGFTRNMAFVQFIISCVLISGALVVLKQITFMEEDDLGFSDKGVMALQINSISYRQNEDNFLKVKNDLEKITSIENVSFSSCLPGEQLINTSIRLSADPVEHTKNCDVQVITSDYFAVYGMEIVEGRMFSETNPGDVNAVVVNQSLAEELNRGDYKNIINNEVTVDWARRPVNFTVVGVVKDYHHFSKKREIQPMLFIPLKNSFGVFRISVKYSDKGNWKSNEHLIQKALKDNMAAPYSKRGLQVAFDVIDVQSAYSEQYRDDEHFSKFLNALTFVAISMAGIGFFSLASTTTRKRTKEIAIRKVYGAQVVDMSILLSTYFIKLGGVAFIISMPISYFLVQDWLSQFSSRIDIGAWFIFFPLIITVGLTVLSITYFILKLAFVNPVNHLRNE